MEKAPGYFLSQELSWDVSPQDGNMFCDVPSRAIPVRAEPAIEIYSIRIFNRFFNYNPAKRFEFFGSIHVTDLDPMGWRHCSLYKRSVDDDDLEAISHPHGSTTLTLTGPDDVISMKQPHLIISIRDKATGNHIVCGQTTLKNATEGPLFEEKISLRVEDVGGAGFAVIRYIALRFAVVARVDIILLRDSGGGSKANEEGACLNVCGSICAYYGNACRLGSSKGGKGRDVCIELFNKSKREAQTLTFGSPMKLSRLFVAVPAYSSFRVEVDLRNPVTNELIVHGQALFETHHYNGCFAKVQTLPGFRNVKAQVIVRWDEPFITDAFSALRFGALYRLHNPDCRIGWPLCEVFSVFIGGNNDEELKISGKIILLDDAGEHITFRYKSYLLKRGCNRLPLEFPPQALEPGRSFDEMIVDLRDISRNVYIAGHAYGMNLWKSGEVGRRICSVIKGWRERYFAAVHTEVFHDAIMATVTVSFGDSSVLDPILHGRLLAFYSKYDYQTLYEKEYYRSVLFDGGMGKNSLEGTSKLKLSRSVVSVPAYSSLKIEVDLKLQSHTVYHDIVLFNPFDPSSNTVCIGSFGIKISVEWSTLKNSTL